MINKKVNIEFRSLIQFLLVIRKISASNLPIGHSSIPYDLLLNVLDSYYMDEPLSVKGLFSRISFSEMGTRSHFNRLIKNDWIKLEVDGEDSRVRVCIPSEKLLDQFTVIYKGIKSCYEIDDPTS